MGDEGLLGWKVDGSRSQRRWGGECWMMEGRLVATHDNEATATQHVWVCVGGSGGSVSRGNERIETSCLTQAVERSLVTGTIIFRPGGAIGRSGRPHTHSSGNHECCGHSSHGAGLDHVGARDRLRGGFIAAGLARVLPRSRQNAPPPGLTAVSQRHR